MNTIERAWVEIQYRSAVELRNTGNRPNEPRIEVIAEYQQMFESRLYPMARSVFTTRLRRR